MKNRDGLRTLRRTSLLFSGVIGTENEIFMQKADLGTRSGEAGRTDIPVMSAYR